MSDEAARAIAAINEAYARATDAEGLSDAMNAGDVLGSRAFEHWPAARAHIRTLEEQVARLTAERCALAWPENFDPPTGLIPCQCCGKGVVEFSIPSPLWNAVVRRGGPEGDREYLCIACWHSAVAAALASGGQAGKAGGA